MGNHQVKEEEKPDVEVQIKQKKAKKRITLEQSRSQNVTIPLAGTCESKVDLVLDGLRFWSSFDGGNLSRVATSPDGRYLLWLAKDCAGRTPKLQNMGHLRQWFQFRIENPLPESREVVLQLENLEAKQFRKIWKNDPDIFIRVHDEVGRWLRHPVTVTETLTTIQVQWKFTLPPNSTVSFAFCCPWSYTHNQSYIKNMEDKFKVDPEIEFSRELLCYSFEGRAVELITLTKRNKQSNELELRYGDQQVLFPKDQAQKPFKHNKPYIFITCRVHAGEQPASYIMKGILDFLSKYKEDTDACAFLDNYVLILIPMLNPDGVYRGHYRLDALGYDPNRVYNRQNKKKKFPAQYAVMETAIYYGSRVKAYIDLHSHSEISNSFMFTNRNPDPQKLITTLILPCLMSFFLDHFSFNPKAMMNSTQSQQFFEEYEGQYTDSAESDDHVLHSSKQILIKKEEESKDSDDHNSFKYVQGFKGIAKSDVYLCSAIEHSYTLETNYKYYFIKEEGKIIKKKFGPKHFEETGKSLLISFLEMDGLRGEHSILQQKGYQNIEQLRNFIQFQL